MRKHTLQKIVLNETALAATIEGEQTVCGQLDVVLYKLQQTNSAGFTGELIIEAKNDDTEWEALPISTIALAADDTVYVEVETTFKYVRPKIIVAAGNADCVIGLFGKTIGA